jgi:hypothetical protein
MFKLIQTCSNKFTVHAEFTVHSAGLSVQLRGFYQLEISLFIFSIK